jgi:PAS domain-containing protein
MDRPDLLVRIAELEAQVARLEHDRGELGEGAILRALMDDIARRRVIETDLRRAHEWLHLAQEAGRVAAYTFDMKAQKLDWSPSTKTLYRFPTDQDATL